MPKFTSLVCPQVCACGDVGRRFPFSSEVSAGGGVFGGEGAEG